MRLFWSFVLSAGLLSIGHLVKADQVSCVTNGSGTDICDIFFPDVLHPSVVYPGLQFVPGDQVMVNASGCVQTGGSGRSWKRYVDPIGNKSDAFYHGLIQIPGAHASLARIQNVTGPVTATQAGPLILGYEDDAYGDNGYWSHDDGNDDQCDDQNMTNQGRAFLRLTITHTVPPFASAGTAYGQCIANGPGQLSCRIDRPTSRTPPNLIPPSSSGPAIRSVSQREVAYRSVARARPGSTTSIRVVIIRIVTFMALYRFRAQPTDSYAFRL